MPNFVDVARLQEGGALLIPEQGDFKKYLANCDTIMNDVPLSEDKFKNAFFACKTNKSPGYDDISFNAINNVLTL